MSVSFSHTQRVLVTGGLPQVQCGLARIHGWLEVGQRQGVWVRSLVALSHTLLIAGCQSR